MDIKNWLLKRKQLKAIKEADDFSYFSSLPFKCPKCHWGTDELTAYVTHLENHLIKKPKIKNKRG